MVATIIVAAITVPAAADHSEYTGSLFRSSSECRLSEVAALDIRNYLNQHHSAPAVAVFPSSRILRRVMLGFGSLLACHYFQSQQ